MWTLIAYLPRRTSMLVSRGAIPHHSPVQGPQQVSAVLSIPTGSRQPNICLPTASNIVERLAELSNDRYRGVLGGHYL